jgi:NADH-ubiquinone oxidoreductase chain 4L
LFYLFILKNNSIYVIAIAGAESAIGLGILVAFYRLRGSISISD